MARRVRQEDPVVAEEGVDPVGGLHPQGVPRPHQEEQEERDPVVELGYLAWVNSEGGRKCPWCGKYRKRGDLFDTSGAVAGAHGPIFIESGPVCRFCREQAQAEAKAEEERMSRPQWEYSKAEGLHSHATGVPGWTLWLYHYAPGTYRAGLADKHRDFQTDDAEEAKSKALAWAVEKAKENAAKWEAVVARLGRIKEATGGDPE